MKKINVLVDWGKSFVDENGSFYCGTTKQQKDNAVRINQNSDLTLFLSDVHSRDSPEFLANKGMYPVHNLIKKDQIDLENLGVEPGKTASPQLTEKLYNLVKDKKSGLIVPRHVFFQNFDGEGNPKPAFRFEDVEETFGVSKLSPKEFLDGKIEYVINAKHMFNGSGLQSTEWIGRVEGVPDVDMNVFTLLKQKYGMGKDLQIDITGVVMGICIYQSASGIKQILPKANINVIADSCTHLVYAPLGIPDVETGNFIAKKMCQQIGVNYITTAEYLGSQSGGREK